MEKKRKKWERVSIKIKGNISCIHDTGPKIGEDYLFVWVLWHINPCSSFNAKSFFIQINSSISNNSV